MARRPVDEKIVKLTMETNDFDRRAAESATLLGKLQQGMNKLPGVNLGKTTAELGQIGAATKDIPMNALTGAVQTVADRFSTLGIIGTTVLTNLTNRAVDMGVKLVKSLTVDQMAEGFNEYEMKMTSIRTILAGTGEDLGTVKGYLEELNSYADRTIYSFGDMTSNIGKFTNAGVPLKDSVAAIQGIANAAALSGANSTNASHAMYNFAQALSAGHVKLIDWKSIETANMATVGFKEQLIESAVAAGTLEKSADGMYKVLTSNGQGSKFDKTISSTENFNDALQYQWMTSEVLVSTLGRYADETTEIGAQSFEAATKIRTFSQLLDTVKESIGSGLGMTFEHILGDYDEATEFFSSLGAVITGFVDKTMDKWNNFVGALADGGAFLNLFAAMGNLLKPIGQLIGAISEGMGKAFSGITADRISGWVKRFKEFTDSLVISDSVLSLVSKTSETFFGGIKRGVRFVVDLAKAIRELVPSSKGVATVLSDMGRSVSVWMSEGSSWNWVNEMGDAFREAMNVFDFTYGETSSVVDSIIEAVKVLRPTAKEIESVADRFKNINKTIATFLSDFGHFMSDLLYMIPGFQDIAEMVGVMTDHFDHAFGETSSIFAGFVEALGIGIHMAKNLLKDFGGFIKRMFAPLVGLIDSIFDGFEFRHLLGGGLLAGVFLIGKKIADAFGEFSGIGELLKGAFEGLGFVKEGVEGIFDSLGEALSGFTASVNAKNIFTIAIAIGILAVSLKLMEDMETEDLVSGIAALAGSMTVLAIGMKAMDGVKLGVGGNVGLVTMAASIAIMVGALKKVSELETENLGASVATIIGLMFSISGAMTMMSRLGGTSTATGALAMIGMATAVKIMVSTLDDIDAVRVEGLIKGLGTIGILMGEIIAFSALMSKNPLSIKSAVAVTILAGALHILVSAIDNVDDIRVEGLVKGLGTIGILLAEIAMFAKYLDGNQISIGSAVGITIIAGAIHLMVSAIKRIDNIRVEGLVKGLLTIAGLLGTIGVFAKMVKGQDLFSTAISLTVLAAALNLMIPPIKILGEMRWKDLVKGLGTLTAMLGVMTIAAKFSGGSMVGAASMVVMAVAMNLLIVPIKTLGEMRWQDLAKGLIGTGIALAGFTLASILLAPVIPLIVGLGAAMVVMGAAMALTGAGVAMFGSGLSALAALTTISVMAIIASLETFFIGLTGIIEAMGGFVKALLLVVLNIIEEVGPELINTVIALAMALVKGFEENIDGFIDLGVSIVMKLMKGIEDHTEPLVTGGADMILALINGLSAVIDEKGPEFTNAITTLIGTVLIVMIKAGLELAGVLLGWIPGISGALEQMSIDAEAVLREQFGIDEVVDEKVQSAQREIETSTGEFRAANSRLGSEGEAGVREGFDGRGVGRDKAKDVASGIESGSDGVKTAGNYVSGQGAYGAKQTNFYAPGRQMAQGLASGMKHNNGAGVKSAGSTLASWAMTAVRFALRINSPSKAAYEDGAFFGEGLGLGILSMTDYVGKQASSVAMKVLDTTNEFLDAVTQDTTQDIGVKVVMDTSEYDSWSPKETKTIQPDFGETNELVEYSRVRNSQNDDNPNRETETTKNETTNNYDVHIHAQGELPRSTIKRMAYQFKEELETQDRTRRINRGEEVVV